MKKVLIITYYWPPCGGIGVLRCLKFAKYLCHYGWEPIIFTAENAHYPSIDHSNDKDIPEGISVLRQKIWEPYHIYKVLTGQKKDANVNNVFYASEKKRGYLHSLSVWIRSNFFIPDARALWINPSVKFLLTYLKENPVDAIISNGPPHSNTRIATQIKKATGIPWLADFQDPWSQVDYFGMLKLTPWGRQKHLRMEQEVFKHADAITIVSDTWKRDLESIGARNVTTIPWGFDPDDYKDLPCALDPAFSITHIGILGSDRHPMVLLNAIEKLMALMPSFKKDLRLQLVGLVDTGIKDHIKSCGMEENVFYESSVERNVALQRAINSRVLLLVLNRQQNAEGRIPGKLFEYLATGRPIFAIGPEKSDVSEIMRKTGSGYYCCFDNSERALEILKTLYQDFKENKSGYQDPNFMQNLTNKHLTGEIAGLLNKICQQRDL